MLASILVILLIVALVVVSLRSAARIYGIEEDRDAAQDAAEALEEERAEAYAEIATLAKERDDAVAAAMLLEKRIRTLPPAQYKPKHRRPWPTSDGMMRLGYRTIDTGGDIVDASCYPRTPHDDKVELARLGMDCATFHPTECDCAGTAALFLDLAGEHESAPEEGA